MRLNGQSIRRRSEITKIVIVVMAVVLMSGTASAQNLPAKKSFDQTDGVLARARAVEDIEYKIMVQRATQAAIYYMPAVVMGTS